MSNMSYCRFANTASDLRDCRDNLDDRLTSEHEIRARKHLLYLCLDILSSAGVDIDTHQAEKVIDEFVAGYDGREDEEVDENEGEE
jgi:hypothetical protein